MAGLINGPAANIIGAGIQALTGGIPLSDSGIEAIEELRSRGFPVPPKNWFSRKLSPREKTEATYSDLESHLLGALKIIQPVLEIKNALESKSKSAERLKTPMMGSPLPYYTPQKPRTASTFSSQSQNSNTLGVCSVKPMIRQEPIRSSTKIGQEYYTCNDCSEDEEEYESKHRRSRKAVKNRTCRCKY